MNVGIVWLICGIVAICLCLLNENLDGQDTTLISLLAFLFYCMILGPFSMVTEVLYLTNIIRKSLNKTVIKGKR